MNHESANHQKPANLDFELSGHKYREIHNQSLLMGLKHDHFRMQKLTWVKQKLSAHQAKTEFGSAEPIAILDFGFGPGELLEDLVRELPAAKTTLFWGVESSTKLRYELKARTQDLNIAIQISEELTSVPEASQDFITCFNVLHHIHPNDRARLARELINKLKPNGSILIWEHNPYNPGTQWIVCRCPYDKDASLLSMKMVQALFPTLQLADKSYVNLFPPNWNAHFFSSLLQFLESTLRYFPLGAQYRLELAKRRE